jgi:hypothetical protein
MLAELIGQPGRLSTLQPMMITVMSLLAVILSVILLALNRRMQKTIPALPSESTVPADQLNQNP